VSTQPHVQWVPFLSPCQAAGSWF